MATLRQFVWSLLLLLGDVRAQAQDDKDSMQTKSGGRLETTGQAVMETRVEQHTFDEEHTFRVSKAVEFFLKFEVPHEVAEEFEEDPERHIFQVNARSPDAEEQQPVDLTIRQFRQMKTFQLPTVERRGSRVVYSSQEYSIDFCPIADIDSNSTVLVSLSTSSQEPITVIIRVLIKGKGADWVEVETASGGKEFMSQTTIKPVISRIRYFDTSLLNTDSIIVKVTTRNDTDCLCSIISIQQPTCPFYDEIGTTMRHGVYSTMLDQGTVILHPKDYPAGFILVLVASAHEDICQTDRCHTQNENMTEPRKRVKITIGSNGSDADYALATMTVICLYIGIFALTITFSILEFRYEHSDFEQVRIKIVEKLEVVREGMEHGANQLKEGLEHYGMMRKSSQAHSVMDGISLIDGKYVEIALGSPLPVQPNVRQNDIEKGQAELLSEEEQETSKGPFKIPQETFEYIDKDDEELRAYNEEEFNSIAEKAKSENSFIASENCSFIDLTTVPEIDTTDMKVRVRMKNTLYVADLSKKLTDPTRTKSVYQKSQLYLGVLFIVSMYYSLPVLQMVFRFSAEQSFTGNQDICYYNDLCRKPLGHVRDFNHVFSNLGYVVFGLLFMCIVLFKKLKFESFLEQNAGINQEEYGVPSQYGLYFSMGLALSMEGVMSSSYHVCPTNVTFQFDTTFMYLIAVLMFMKLYQVRHSDVSANAVGVFFGLGVALFLETISIYYSGPWFWAFFCTVYIIVIVVVSVHAYNIGAVKYNWGILCVVARILAIEMQNMVNKYGQEEKVNTNKARPRLVCLILIALVNIVMCLYFGISGTPGASNYLLAIFFMNLALYGSYYCTMKILHGEKINKIPMLYACLGLICFVPSLYFFTMKEKKTGLSPSESRDLNRECQFLNFFDGHDIWHFLGAAGVFFAFLCIFTLDEDVKFKKRDSIRVF